MQTEYKAGDKIFAKVKGHPHWPARINLLPEDAYIPKGKYPIFFYGTHETYFLASKDIYPYEKYREKYGKLTNRKVFNDGLDEIIENPNVLMLGYKDGETSQPVIETNMKKGTKRKLDISHSSSQLNKSAKKQKLNSSMSNFKSQEKLKSKSSKFPMSRLSLSPLRRSVSSKKNVRKSEDKENVSKELSVSLIDINSPSPPKKVVQKSKKEMYLHQVKLKLTLTELDIKTSLSGPDHDVNRCMEVMTELENLPLNSFLLKQNPDIVITIKNCRKYTKSQAVRLKAEFLFAKFKALFLVGNDADIFNKTFTSEMAAFKTDKFLGGSKASQYLNFLKTNSNNSSPNKRQQNNLSPLKINKSSDMNNLNPGKSEFKDYIKNNNFVRKEVKKISVINNLNNRNSKILEAGENIDNNDLQMNALNSRNSLASEEQKSLDCRNVKEINDKLLMENKGLNGKNFLNEKFIETTNDTILIFDDNLSTNEPAFLNNIPGLESTENTPLKSYLKNSKAEKEDLIESVMEKTKQYNDENYLLIHLKNTLQLEKEISNYNQQKLDSLKSKPEKKFEEISKEKNKNDHTNSFKLSKDLNNIFTSEKLSNENFIDTSILEQIPIVNGSLKNDAIFSKLPTNNDEIKLFHKESSENSSLNSSSLDSSVSSTSPSNQKVSAIYRELISKISLLNSNNSNDYIEQSSTLLENNISNTIIHNDNECKNISDEFSAKEINAAGLVKENSLIQNKIGNEELNLNNEIALKCNELNQSFNDLKRNLIEMDTTIKNENDILKVNGSRNKIVKNYSIITHDTQISSSISISLPESIIHTAVPESKFNNDIDGNTFHKIIENVIENATKFTIMAELNGGINNSSEGLNNSVLNTNIFMTLSSSLYSPASLNSISTMSLNTINNVTEFKNCYGNNSIKGESKLIPLHEKPNGSLDNEINSSTPFNSKLSTSGLKQIDKSIDDFLSNLKQADKSINDSTMFSDDEPERRTDESLELQGKIQNLIGSSMINYSIESEN